MKSWWYKSGPGKNVPWSLKVNGFIVDYNHEFIKQLRSSLSDIQEHLTDTECIRVSADEQHLEFLRKKFGDKPWADFKYTNGKLTVSDYNKPFVEEIKVKIGHQLDEELSDDQLVKLYVDRENIEREEPRLDVIHLGIEDDGNLKIELDWNKSFIEMLKKNGITGETEDDAIREYLARLTTEQTPDLSDAALDDAFADIDAQLSQEFQEAAEKINKTKKRKRL